MKNRFLLGVAGVALAAGLGSGNASAQWFTMPANGAFYVGGEGGWTWLNDTDINLRAVSGKEKFDGGPVLGLRAGYEWGPWRLEEEFAYRINGITGVGRFAADGNRTSYAFMTNLLYGIDLGWPIVPHIGGGIGAVLQRDGWSNPIVGTVGASTAWNFGYQGIAGIRYNINPSLAFDVDYRYFGVLDTDFTTRNGPLVRAGASNKYSAGNSSNNILASFIVKFGAPPPPVVAPPAPPAPPPVQRKVFLVFFDWDKYSITPEGMQILQQAAAAYRSGAPVQIQVTGYTDRSGSPGYNQRLSERRANAVATALEGLGVPRSQMIVSGRGENDNRVPTADGVREPQNRRVEIIFP
ncbi:MAG: OmpA family protein [Alphaproteobacteria bacterium]